jgi:tRNA(Ile2) C34 agmatinyltransferase TiaS
MLNPVLKGKTMGNASSFIELAVEPAVCSRVINAVWRFVQDEALSPEWGVAIKRGFCITEELESFAADVRAGTVSRDHALEVAGSSGILLKGGRGVIGALAAIAFIGQESVVLLDPRAALQPRPAPHKTG